MTTINEQNAKQIRKPMEVYVRMDLSDKSITMTYSGYSSAKIADGKLDQTDWKMRKLTDLQGDGFPLDSSCTLYNPSTAASASSGKIGVRGNIGEPVSVTVTGSAVMDSATIIVTGASSVSHDGGTSAIIGSSVIVSIEDSSATLVFTPKSADRRVEISDIIPGIMFNVTNENMISCTLSLRADLSIVDPTLPESEMNLEFYNDEDISEILAAIPEDTPITYRAGYDGDLSPERKFYIADQVTYKDNVISVHAVDAVHFLDTEIVTPLRNPSQQSIKELLQAILSWKLPSYVKYETTRGKFFYFDYVQRPIIDPGITYREYIAWINLLYKTKYSSDFEVFAEYVDAGIPTARDHKNTDITRIEESDCGDIVRNIDAKRRIRLEWKQMTPRDYTVVGSGELLKNIGATFKFEYPTREFGAGILLEENGDTTVEQLWLDAYGHASTTANIVSFIPANKNGEDFPGYPGVGNYARLFYGETPRQHYTSIDTDGIETDIGVYSQFVPWTQSIADFSGYDSSVTSFPTLVSSLTRARIINSQNNSSLCTLALHGNGFEIIDKEAIIGEIGDIVEVSSPLWGESPVKETSSSADTYPFLPTEVFRQALQHSPNTGSFTWKGDPRMQPRDVFTFVKLDGTEIDCTIEQIDLEHVGGGTTAKITYREGIV